MAAFRSNRTTENTFERAVVINDVKLLAQADVEATIDAFATFDSSSKKIYDAVSIKNPLSFQFVDLHIPYHETFGILPV